MAFVPVSDGVEVSGRVSEFEVPVAELAVTALEGAFGDLVQTYGALGNYVAERELGVEGPIRVYYLVTPFDTEDEVRRRAPEPEPGRGRWRSGRPHGEHPAVVLHDGPDVVLGEVVAT